MRRRRWLWPCTRAAQQLSAARGGGARVSCGEAVALEHPAAQAWLEVGAIELAVVMSEHAVVPHTPPERREHREQDHARVAGWQLRRLVDMAQRLVAADRVGVVVGVPLQVV